jgi:hypothetical protein
MDRHARLGRCGTAGVHGRRYTLLEPKTWEAHDEDEGNPDQYESLERADPQAQHIRRFMIIVMTAARAIFTLREVHIDLRSRVGGTILPTIPPTRQVAWLRQASGGT